MPSIREKQTKDGRTFYEIQVSRGRSRSRLTSRWYPPEGGVRKQLTGNWQRLLLNLSAVATMGRL